MSEKQYGIDVIHEDGARRPLTRGLTVRAFNNMAEAEAEAARRNRIACEIGAAMHYIAMVRDGSGA